MSEDSWLVNVLMFAPIISLGSVFLAIGGVFPLLRIFQRLGLKKRRILWLYLPFINVFFLWKLASEHWPNVRSESRNA